MELPAKSIVRFLCVSKLWKTIIKDYIVKDSILTRSLTQDPHFIFESVFSPNFSIVYSHHQTTDKEEQLSLDETYLKDSYSIPEFQYVRGLIGYKSSPHHCCPRFTIHNLITRQSLHYTVSTQSYEEFCYFFLGYDPLTKEMSCRVYTLGNSKKQWRNIPCKIELHCPSSSPGSVCINGEIYYMAIMNRSYVLVSVDVVSERIIHVQTPEELSICHATLVDYKGKLGCICKDNLNMDLWVLKNTEWSKINTYVDVFRDIPSCFGVAGITHPGGEVVFVCQSQDTSVTPIIVYYYDMKLKKSRKAEIKTSTSSRELKFIVKFITHHVENIMSLS